MKTPESSRILEDLLRQTPCLGVCRTALEESIELLLASFRTGGKVLIAGNGGSAADSDHIVGELMKGFRSRRPVTESDREGLNDAYPEEAAYLCANLQGALPAISLVSHTALTSAICNDLDPQIVFAQQVWGYGKPGDVLLAFSTSGNSTSVCHAVRVATFRGLETIAFTGASGGLLADLCRTAIKVPAHETYRVQELHLPIYHALCAVLEAELFAP